MLEKHITLPIKIHKTMTHQTELSQPKVTSEELLTIQINQQE